jgi:hypothetical protein
LAVEGHVLINRQSFALGVAGNELQLGVGHSRVAGEPGDRLMSECVWVPLTSGALRLPNPPH